MKREKDTVMEHIVENTKRYEPVTPAVNEIYQKMLQFVRGVGDSDGFQFTSCSGGAYLDDPTKVREYFIEEWYMLEELIITDAMMLSEKQYTNLLTLLDELDQLFLDDEEGFPERWYEYNNDLKRLWEQNISEKKSDSDERDALDLFNSALLRTFPMIFRDMIAE